jgi:predicted transcriptional regulator
MNNIFDRFFHSPLRVRRNLSAGAKRGLAGLLITALLFTSCKHQKVITGPVAKCNLDYKNAKTLTANLKANEFNFNRFNAKLNAEIAIDSSINSFVISLRVKKDSIIWMSISKLGIEGARVLITKDSVSFINRINNKYFKGDYSYVSKLLNTQLDYEMLQSLLVGNSVAFYDEDEKIKPGISNCLYTLGTIRKYKLRRVMEKGKELKEPAQSIYMIPETFKISRILFYEFNPERSFDAGFYDYTKVDSTQLFPLKMHFTVKAQKNVIISIDYTKIQLNEAQSFPFKIPDNYEQIIYKEKQ